jgi:hypothetical protein
MDWKNDDGQVGLRASIASQLKAAGMGAQQAEQQATSEANWLRNQSPGEYEVHAGNTVIIVEVK